MQRFAIAALLACSQHAVAQDRPASAEPPALPPIAQTPPIDPIVVTTPRLPDKKQVRALTRAIATRVPFDEPLARFVDPVCFATVGLPRKTLERIGDRLAANAEQAGVRLAGKDCEPNIAILFLDQGQQQVTLAAKRSPWLFGNRMPTDVRRILNAPGPVHSWSNSELRGVDGLPFSASGMLKVFTGTRIVMSVRRDTQASIMIIDRSALLGKTTHQIADYVAMRTLAVVQPEGAAKGETILSLFDTQAGTAPPAMTAFDRTYLKTLYAGAPGQTAVTTISRIAQNVVKGAQAAGAATSKRQP